MPNRLNRAIMIELEGDEESDLELAFEEVKRLIGEGYTSGFNGNESGEFRFTISTASVPVVS